MKQKKLILKYFLNIFFFSWIFGLLSLLVSLCALSLSSYVQYNDNGQRRLQSIITSILDVKLENGKEPPDDYDINKEVKVEQELDTAIQSFFNRIIRTFISSWYSNLTQDENFVHNIKLELAVAVRKIALRIKNVRIRFLIHCSTINYD